MFVMLTCKKVVTEFLAVSVISIRTSSFIACVVISFKRKYKYRFSMGAMLLDAKKNYLKFGLWSMPEIQQNTCKPTF